MFRAANAHDTFDDRLGRSFEDGLLEVVGVELEIYFDNGFPSCAATVPGDTSLADERPAFRRESDVLVVHRHE